MIDTGTPYRCWINVNKMMKKLFAIVKQASEIIPLCEVPNCDQPAEANSRKYCQECIALFME